MKIIICKIVFISILITFGIFCGCGSRPDHNANWWYYWKDGQVIDGLDSTKWMWDMPHRGYSSPHETTQLVGLSDPAILERTATLNLESFYDTRIPKVPVAVEVPGAKGIDSVAITISHEFKHVWVYQQWGKKIGYTGTGHSDTDAIPDSVEDDRTPGSIGATYQFNSNDPDCYRMRNYFPAYAHYEIYGDSEILARVEGFTNPKTTYPDKDWSKGGEQWQH